MPPLPPLPSAVPAPNDDLDGWYLRGDIGYRINQVASASTTVTADPIADNIDRSWAIGLGLGVKRNWLRADFTVDYGAPAKYRGDTAAQPIAYTARIESFTGLANLYADLGTWYGITPYVGAGAGGSYLRVLDFFTAAAVPPISGPVGGSWRFSWALMAGVSYGVGRMALDLGYRRLNLGTARSAANAAGDQLEIKDIVADEFRLGMRFAL